MCIRHTCSARMKRYLSSKNFATKKKKCKKNNNNLMFKYGRCVRVSVYESVLIYDRIQIFFQLCINMNKKKVKIMGSRALKLWKKRPQIASNTLAKWWCIYGVCLNICNNGQWMNERTRMSFDHTLTHLFCLLLIFLSFIVYVICGFVEVKSNMVASFVVIIEVKSLAMHSK